MDKIRFGLIGSGWRASFISVLQKLFQKDLTCSGYDLKIRKRVRLFLKNLELCCKHC